MINRRIALTHTNIFFLLVMTAFLVLNIVIAIVAEILYRGGFNQYDPGYVYTTTLINEFLLLLVPVCIFALANRVNFREFFRFRLLKPLPAVMILLAALPAYFAALMLNTVVLYFLQFLGELPVQPIPVPGNLQELLVGILVISVTPAICEEMLHRGVMLRAYEKRGTAKAVVITGLFFGFFHFDITNLLGTAFLGIIIAYYVVRTDSIFAGMLAHFLNNTIAEVTQYVWGDKTIPDKITISAAELGSTLLYGAAGLIALAFLLILFKRLTRGTAVSIPSISSAGKDAAAVLTHWPVIVFLVLYLFLALIYIAAVILKLY